MGNSSNLLIIPSGGGASLWEEVGGDPNVIIPANADTVVVGKTSAGKLFFSNDGTASAGTYIRGGSAMFFYASNALKFDMGYTYLLAREKLLNTSYYTGNTGNDTRIRQYDGTRSILFQNF